ncbi:MAG: DUF1440 domain-containing protein [Gemmatimonadales bacterium]|nr:DUF1440 domain-containing protein [Gemmatimonadales bacterium]
MVGRSKDLGVPHPPEVGLGRVILSGLIAGLVATGAKTLCEVISPPRPPGVLSPLGNALDAVSLSLTGMPDRAKAVSEPAVHLLFGTLAGGAFAGIERHVPQIRAGYGALFGVSFWLLVHEGVLPWLGLSPTPAQMTVREQRNELVSHTVFGVVLESVRRALLRTRG